MAYYNQLYNPGYVPNYNPGFQQNQDIQNGGFVTVQSEQEARTCPIRHGTSVTFRNENAPYIYTKTLGFSQMDSPVFEVYRLVRETPQNAQNGAEIEKADDSPIYVTKAEFEALREELNSLRKELGDE